MYRKGFSVLAMFLMVMSVCLPAYAQVDSATATLKGVVADPNGAIIAGATITVTNVDKGTSKSAKTNSDGTYQIPLLQPGAYQVAVEAPGFGKSTAKLSLSVGQSLVYDISLMVGGITNAIEVSPDAPLIQVEQTQQANTISQSQVENLPNINRNMTAAVFTLPGVSDSEATRSQQPGFTGFRTTGFSIGGSNGRNNLSTIDGGENEYGSGQYRVQIPVDAIQEFQVNRNSFAAEQGFTVGSAVNIVTKSGGNTPHGSAYGYFRNNTTQALNFIDQVRRQVPELREEPFNQNVYAGGTMGGPLKKDKLFFFVAYEFQKLNLGATNFLLNSPAALGVSGVNVINGVPQPNTGYSGANHAAQLAYVNLLRNGAPGAPATAGTRAVADALTNVLTPQLDPNFHTLLARDNGNYDALTRSHTLLSRVDYQPNADNSLNFRFEMARALVGRQNYFSGAGLETRDYSILTNWAHTFTSSLVNQFRIQVVPYNKADNLPNVDTGSIAVVPAGTPAPLTVQGFAIGGFVPSFTFGSPAAIPYLAHQKRFQFEDSISWTKSNHNLKFGASYRPVHYHVEDDLYFAGQSNFADATYPLILGIPAALRANATGAFAPPANTTLSAAQSFVAGFPSFYHQGFNNPKWDGWAHYFGGFAQDSWKVNQKLSLDYGVRFDLDSEPSPLSRNNYFSPRFGFAYTPSSDRKTVIRGGAGLFEGPIDVLIPSYGSLLDDSGKYINQIFPTGQAAASIYQAGLALGVLPFGHLTEAQLNGIRNTFFPNGVPTGQGNNNRVVFLVDPNYKNPYSVQASLSIQRELAQNLSAEVGYLMYHGLNLQMPVETNYRETGVVDSFVGPQYVVKDPTILQQVGYDSRGKSIYHALTASLTKRTTHGLQFGANYTFSKSIDDVIDFSSSQTWFRPNRLNTYRAVSVFDFTHVFSLNSVYHTPFKGGDGSGVVSKVFSDITIAPILTLRSGIPFSVRMTTLRNGTGGAPLANPALATITNPFGGGSIDANFATPFAASRNSSRGAPYYSLDLRLQKSLHVFADRGVRLDIVAEGVNILNRANFNKVWDEFVVSRIDPPTANAPRGVPIGVFDNGTSVNLLTGPYNLKGFKPTTANQLSGHPLVFTSADTPRQVQFALKLTF